MGATLDKHIRLFFQFVIVQANVLLAENVFGANSEPYENPINRAINMYFMSIKLFLVL